MSIGKALQKASRLQAHVVPGKQAMNKTARHAVVESGFERVVDSLDLDSATKEDLPDKNRWDYLLGTTARGAAVIAVEVHPATAKEARALIAKKNAAIALLENHWTRTGQTKRWFWIASGRSALPPTTPEARLVNKAGIEFVGSKLDLAKWLGRP